METTIIHKIFTEQFHDLATKIINTESAEVKNSLYEAYLNLNVDTPITYEEIPIERERGKQDIEYSIKSTIVKVTDFLKIVVSIFHKYFATKNIFLPRRKITNWPR
jgi:hypothetical protein